MTEALARNLAAADAAAELPQARPRIEDALMLPVHQLRPNKWNREVDAASAAEMAATLKPHGVLQPIIVRPAPPDAAGTVYEIVAGERRWRGSQYAGIDMVPALVRELDDQQVQQIMLVENLARRGLHELDEAEGYDRLLRKDSGPQALRGFASVVELAESIGRSESYVTQRLRLLKLLPAGKEAFRDGKLTFSLALRVARLSSEKDQAAAMKGILDGWGGEPLSAREADEFIRRQFMLDLSRAVFSRGDATLVPDAGTCTDCPKRTGTSPDLFGDIKQGDTCTDSGCFERKVSAHQARVKAQAEERGLKVITGAAAKKIIPSAHADPKGYLELDETHHKLDGSKPLRKLLGKADVKPVLVENPHTRQLVEMVPEAEAVAALKASGVLKQARMPSTSASERDTQERNKRETAWRMALAEDCLAAARGEAGEDGRYRAGLVQRVALLLWHEMHHDARVRLVKLLGWPPLKGRYEDGPGPTADKHISALDGPELCRYLTACTFVHDTYIASYQVVTKPERLLAAAELLGVDVQAAKDRVRDLKKTTPDKAAAARAVQRAGQLTPASALAAALKKEKAAQRLGAPKGGVKYRDPATGSTWSGRGLQPAWLKAAMAGGATLASFAVGAAPAATVSAAGAAVGLPAGSGA